MKIERKNDSLLITLPLVKGGKTVYSDKVHTREYAMGLMQTFSKFLIGSLERRMEACQRNFLEHLSEICFVSEGAEHIEWPTGQFNTISYEVMQQAINWIDAGLYEEFLRNTAMLDQTVKALLNDTEQHPDKIESYRYSELISLLAEHHAFNACTADPHFDSARKESTGSGLWIGERPQKK